MVNESNNPFDAVSLGSRPSVSSAAKSPTVQPSHSSDTPAQGDDAHKPIGAIVGQYRLMERIGEGGMGVVYRASHTLIERVVAMKMLAPRLTKNPGAVQRFLQEAQASVRLKHDGIVTVYDVGQDGDAVYMTMALIEGESLAQYVRKRGPMPPKLALSVIVRVAQALMYAHARGVIHRDIKPQNIMFQEPGQVTLLDMGIARVLDADLPTMEESPADYLPTDDSNTLASRLTATGKIMGTLAYMSPEQAADPRQADARSDIYSLGCTLYYLLTGDHAFQGRATLETLENQLAGRYRRLSEHLANVPGRVERCLETMIAIRPQDRFRTAADAAIALRRCLDASYAESGGMVSPVTLVPTIPGYAVSVFGQPYDDSLDGDFYGFVSLPNGKAGIFLGDVCGSGQAAAELRMKTVNELQQALLRGANIVDAIAHLNRKFQFGTQGWDDRFVTLALCLLDAATSRVTLVNAGHMPPFVRRKHGVFEELGEEQTGVPIGVAAEFVFEEWSFELSPGETVTLYTDGVCEAINAQAELYGLERMRRQLHGDFSDASELGRRILDDVKRFGGEPPHCEDLCLVCFRAINPCDPSAPTC